MKTKAKPRPTTRSRAKTQSRSPKRQSAHSGMGVLGWVIVFAAIAYVGWAVSQSGDLRGAKAWIVEGTGTVYISDSGDDKNLGTAELPKRTFTSAMELVNQGKGTYTAIGVLGESYHVTALDVMDLPSDLPIQMDVAVASPVVVSGFKKDPFTAVLKSNKTPVIQTIGGGSLLFQIKRGAMEVRGLEFQTVNGVFVNVLDAGKLTVLDNTFTNKDFTTYSQYQLAVQHFQKGSSSIRDNQFRLPKKIDTITSAQAIGLNVMGGGGTTGSSEVAGNSFFYPRLDQVDEQMSLPDRKVFPNVGIMATGELDLMVKLNKFVIDRSKYPSGAGGPKAERNVGIMMPSTAKAHIEANTFTDFYGTPLVSGATTSGSQYIGVTGNKK